MADKRLNIKIRTDGAKKAKGALGGVDRSMKTLAKSAMAAGAAFFGARAIISGIKTVINLEREQTLAVKKLETALGKNSSALQKQASALQQVTTFGDETIIQAQAMLAMFIKDEEQLKKATIATLDLAAAKGMDLVQAADLVGKSVGSSTNALARYGVSAEGAAGSSERLNSIVDGMTKYFGGQATAVVDTMAGSLDQMSNAVGDVGEIMGEKLSPIVTDVSKAIKGFAEAVGDYIAIPASEKIDKDRFASERLFNVLEDVNASQKVRTDAIKTINSKYGSYLTNLLTEKSSLKDIQKAQDDINKKMLERIAIEVQREEIADNMREMKSLWKDEANLINDVSKAEKKLSEKQTAATISHKLAIEQMELQGKIAPQVASANLDMVESFVSFAGGAEAAGAGVHAANQSLINAEERLEANRKKQEELTEQTEKLREEQVKLAETFGVAPTEAKGGSPEIDVLIMTEDQKASIRAEYNERFLEMTKGSYELQSIELDNAVERFREAGIEEVEIARFTKEAKEQLYLNTAQSFASSVAGNLAIMTKAGMITGKEAKRAAQAQAIVDTYAAANAAYKAMAGIPVIGPGLGALAAATAIAAGIANVKMIESQSFAQGGDFVTSGPQMIAVGDNPGGRERVQVTPLSSPNIDGPQGGITINISAPLVDETVVDSIIPAIEKAVRRNQSNILMS